MPSLDCSPAFACTSVQSMSSSLSLSWISVIFAVAKYLTAEIPWIHAASSAHGNLHVRVLVCLHPETKPHPIALANLTSFFACQSRASVAVIGLKTNRRYDLDRHVMSCIGKDRRCTDSVALAEGKNQEFGHKERLTEQFESQR